MNLKGKTERNATNAGRNRRDEHNATLLTDATHWRVAGPSTKNRLGRGLTLDATNATDATLREVANRPLVRSDFFSRTARLEYWNTRGSVFLGERTERNSTHLNSDATDATPLRLTNSGRGSARNSATVDPAAFLPAGRKQRETLICPSGEPDMGMRRDTCISTSLDLATRLTGQFRLCSANRCEHAATLGRKSDRDRTAIWFFHLRMFRKQQSRAWHVIMRLWIT